MQKRLFFLIATLLTVSLTALAQVTTSGINGKVTLGDANGETAIGATVQAVHQPSGTRYGAVTNVEGRYSIQGMRAGGPYTVTVSYIGSQTKTFEGITFRFGWKTTPSRLVKSLLLARLAWQPRATVLPRLSAECVLPSSPR